MGPRLVRPDDCQAGNAYDVPTEMSQSHAHWHQRVPQMLFDSIGMETCSADEGLQEKHETQPPYVRHVSPQDAGLSQWK